VDSGAKQWPLTPSYAADLYAGTAELYAAHRIAYPPALLRGLLAGAAARGALLDLACGTGELAIPLSAHFERVLAVDQEPSMVEVGRRKARAARIRNITWSIATAETLTLPAGSVDLIAIGSAFHRLDRPHVARLGLRWLKPRARIALVNADGVWDGTEPWQRAAVEAIREFTAASPAPAAQGPRLTHEDVLRQAGYDEITETWYAADHVWTIEGFLGYLHSTAVLSKAKLGQDIERFQARLRRTLLEIEPSGRLAETARFSRLTARRP
jgi:SAM-dependent methyltransferase